MWDDLAQLMPGLNWGVVLVYVRVQASLLVLPGFGERVIPGRVKVALAMAIAPLLAVHAPAPVHGTGYLAQIAGEMLIGFMIGGLLRLLALAIDIATTAIATTASLSQVVGVQNESAPHPIGNMLHLGGIAILMALGLPIMVVQMLADSLLLWPPASWPDPTYAASQGARMVAQTFWLAMVLAAPFSLGGFLYQALLGLISRVMPALPVVFIGSPAAIFLALSGLALLAPMLVGLWVDAVLSFTLPRPS
ncbi:flagellar biosynthetic protein FliR [Paracoccus sp. (in: a-proteobacteria)]|uniref:flagellar biosynthetic protein FliR n=1 Tax=Paracoccus sp. TaxID=267 RepID=UPI0026E02695|nr:flagellar biosynthetic protein FliR [Paracoccus sp. (in: a-proteobacteria)]MDO5648397.1 flagellar biosynthetic protein FliR [Paracoccus sp. (in: a-proteobacteria)]